MKRVSRTVGRSILLMVSIVVLASGCSTASGVGVATPNATENGDTHPPSSLLDVPEIEEFDLRTQALPEQFAKFAQCQFEITPGTPTEADLPQGAGPDAIASQIRECLTIAIQEDVDVLIFPELALQLPPEIRKALLNELQAAASLENMVIVAGSFYDENRFASVPIISPQKTVFGQKLRPSRYESSTVSGKGMVPGKAVPVIHTDYGSFAILTCADLISDQAQFVARRLATLGRIDGIINNCCNPAALEFLIEANAIARRHPVFVMVTNSSAPKGKCGHTSLLVNLGERPYTSNSDKDLLAMLPPELVQQEEEGKSPHRLLPYDCVVADVGTVSQAMLIYELNLLLPSIPAVTNAPDQGYPPVRNLKIMNPTK